MAIEYMLTTVDNPYNPHVEFDDWNEYDKRSGYHTLAFLARIVRTSDDLSDVDQELAIDTAIDEIIKENVSGMYMKISPTDQAGSWNLEKLKVEG